MKKLYYYLKYRKQIVMLLRYSLNEVPVEDYRYLTRAEKIIISDLKTFKDIKSL